MKKPSPPKKVAPPRPVSGTAGQKPPTPAKPIPQHKQLAGA